MTETDQGSIRMAEKQKAVSPERIHQLGWGYATPLLLEAGVRCRVFDVLDSGPKTVAMVAAETGASPRGLRPDERPRRPGISRQAGRRLRPDAGKRPRIWSAPSRPSSAA